MINDESRQQAVLSLKSDLFHKTYVFAEKSRK